MRHVLAIVFDPLDKIEGQVLVDQIHSLNESMKKLEATIKEKSPKQDDHKNLRSIKGLGAISASFLLSVIYWILLNSFLIFSLMQVEQYRIQIR